MTRKIINRPAGPQPQRMKVAGQLGQAFLVIADNKIVGQQSGHILLHFRQFPGDFSGRIQVLTQSGQRLAGLVIGRHHNFYNLLQFPGPLIKHLGNIGRQGLEFRGSADIATETFAQDLFGHAGRQGFGAA